MTITIIELTVADSDLILTPTGGLDGSLCLPVIVIDKFNT